MLVRVKEAPATPNSQQALPRATAAPAPSRLPQGQRKSRELWEPVGFWTLRLSLWGQILISRMSWTQELCLHHGLENWFKASPSYQQNPLGCCLVGALWLLAGALHNAGGTEPKQPCSQVLLLLPGALGVGPMEAQCCSPLSLSRYPLQLPGGVLRPCFCQMTDAPNNKHLEPSWPSPAGQHACILKGAHCFCSPKVLRPAPQEPFYFS